MPSDTDSRVVMRQDGYIEVTFSGLQSADRLKELIAGAKELARSAEPAIVNLLIDARNGRVNRDARSFAHITSIGRVKNLEKVSVLISDDPLNAESGRETNLVVTLFGSAIGFRPTYFTDEVEARASVVVAS